MIYRQLPNGESQYFVYDTENQLAKAEIKKNSGETQTWEYAYDPFGRRLSKERTDKGALQSTAPKRTHFVWDGSRLLQEHNYRGNYTYIYTDQDSYEPLAQVFLNAQDDKQYLAYFHNDQIGIPKEMTDQFGNLVWYGEYTAWGKLHKDERVYQYAHQPFRLQNQYFDEETGLHYNLMRYYEADSGRFVNQDPIGLEGGANLYFFAPNIQNWIDVLGLIREHQFGIFKDTKNKGAEIGNGIQRHHLNQTETFRFDRDAGDVIGLKGQAKVKGTPHNAAHFHLDNFYDKYRNKPKTPLVLRYNFELFRSLRKAGVGRIASLKGVFKAIGEQRRNRVRLLDRLPNLPNRVTKKAGRC